MLEAEAATGASLLVGVGSDAGFGATETLELVSPEHAASEAAIATIARCPSLRFISATSGRLFV